MYMDIEWNTDPVLKSLYYELVSKMNNKSKQMIFFFF